MHKHGQFAVAVRRVLLLAGQGRYHVAERRQRLIDGRRLAELLARRARLGEALAPGQVEQAHFAADDGAVQSTRAVDVDVHDQVRSAAAVVHPRRSRVPCLQAPMEDVVKLRSARYGAGSRALHPHDAPLVLLDLEFHLGNLSIKPSLAKQVLLTSGWSPRNRSISRSLYSSSMEHETVTLNWA